MPGSPWEVRAGYEVLRERWSQRYGLGAGPNVLETPQDGHLQVSRDTRDDAFLPKSGTYFNVLGGYRYGTLSGSDTPFARGEMNWTYTPISTKQPKCWPTECAADNCDRQSLLNRLSSGWRLHLAGEGGTQAQHAIAEPYKFALGGPFQLSAFQIGEYRASDYSLGSAYLLKELHRFQPPLGQGLYGIVGIEGGEVYDAGVRQVSPFSVVGSLSLSMPLGNLSLGAADGTAGRKKLFVTFGKLF